jgi:hypothetical protein
VKFSPVLKQYVDALMEYGYEDTAILREAEEGDLEDAFDECRVKKPHRRLICKALKALKALVKS